MSTFRQRYEVMISGQVPPDVMAQWLADVMFAKYVARQRAFLTTAQPKR